jgi:uroporphyrinogen-III synthase
LKTKKVLITRSRAQSTAFAAALVDAGFEPVCFPVIEIRPAEDLTALDRALAKLDCYDWVVFTSVNGVDVFFSRPSALAGKEVMGEGTKVAAIGPKTAAALQARGVTSDFVPEEYVAEAILPGLGDLSGRWVLLPRAEIARKSLPEAISRAGGVAHEIAVYHTLPAEPDPIGLSAIKSGVGWITFTSPSTVQNFCAVARAHDLDPLVLPATPKIACIGPITEQAAREEGLSVDLVAEEYTTDGLIAALGRVTWR